MQAVFRSAPRFARASFAAARPVAPRFARPQFVRTLVTTKYTAEHESVRFDDETGVGIVGITHHAQEALGDVVFVELPSEGSDVKLGDQIGAVESVKAASDIYAPISGVIEAVNTELDSQPSLLNKSPEDKGWLCKIKLSDPAELDGLMSEEAYTKHVESSE
ncbi:glycine cleavage H-protein-domain-containing protein [Schizophyllum amplum]|uniref:Glycine cleavage system H protein n=1 Tax=Schizophyllum amplum TaxID=97359 RepID=A0A550CMX3_9AGAR|nr:glycine cleavage H-protein-domain-containing protein [Auriculariopsis ampla]